MGDDTILRLFDQLTAEQREQLTRQFEERDKEIAGCTAEMRKTVSKLRARGHLTHEAIWNACLFINVVSHDLSILIHALAFERDEWRRRFIARSLALVLYEVAEDIPAVLGKRFQKAMLRLRATDELRSNLRAAQKNVTQFWDANHDYLKQIRVVSAAHRDHDAMTQLEIIDRIDLLKMLDLGLELGKHLNAVGRRAQAIMTNTAKCPPPELSITSA